MASSIITRHFALEILVCLFVILFVKMVTSVQPEKCFPQVDRVRYWAQVGSQFEVNCTLINCDNNFETPVWERNGKSLKNYRTNQVFFPTSKRQKLLIDPVEESDKGEYTCRTQIHDHSQNLELIIGVEPTTPTTTTTTTTPSPTTTTITTTNPSTSPTVKTSHFVSTASATFKVTNTPIKIIKTTKMLLTFTGKATTTPETNHSSRLLDNLSMTTFLLIMLIQIFIR